MSQMQDKKRGSFAKYFRGRNKKSNLEGIFTEQYTFSQLQSTRSVLSINRKRSQNFDLQLAY